MRVDLLLFLGKATMSPYENMYRGMRFTRRFSLKGRITNQRTAESMNMDMIPNEMHNFCEVD